MRNFFTAFLFFLFLFLDPILSVSDSFYLWQQEYNSAVLTAIKKEESSTIYPLSCTVKAKGKSSLVSIPWKKLQETSHRFIPVIRIPLSAFKRNDISVELDRITQKIQQEKGSLKGIQFDLDCPERLLPRYLNLIKIYHKRHPKLFLSITALPVHLPHQTFSHLAQLCDEFVIQVHGIEIPKKFTDHTQLLNIQVAKRAIRQADRIGRPFLVALPCYAYELHFDKKSKRFLFLTAEKTSYRRDTLRKRIAPNFSDLLELQKDLQTKKQAKGIIWFRLPIAGDQLCWPRKTVKKLQEGIQPKEEMLIRYKKINDQTIEIELYNSNTISCSNIQLAIHWPQPTGAFDLYNGIKNSSSSTLLLPTQLTFLSPAPGQSVKIGWFRTPKDSLPNIKVYKK